MLDRNKKRVMNFAIIIKNVQNAQFLTSWQVFVGDSLRTMNIP